MIVVKGNCGINNSPNNCLFKKKYNDIVVQRWCDGNGHWESLYTCDTQHDAFCCKLSCCWVRPHASCGDGDEASARGWMASPPGT